MAAQPTIPTEKFEAIVTAYAAGANIQNICDDYKVTRSDVADVVALSGVHRSMDGQPAVTIDDVVRLYAMLRATQLELEALQQQVSDPT